MPVQLWLDGVDHQRPGARIPEALEVVRKAMPDAEVVFSTLPVFAEAAAKYSSKMPASRGSSSTWRRAEGGYIYPHQPLPVEPLPDEAGQRPVPDDTRAMGGAVPGVDGDSAAKAPASPNFLDVAWQYLMQNHPHDSICGCSIDQVHKDTEYRYDQCAMIAEEVLEGLPERGCAEA